jgi:hypothetical protein
VKVTRSDYGAIKRFERTPQGGLRLDAFPTRAGVLTYLDRQGNQRKELRHPDDVFEPASLESLKHAPLTDLHPPSRVDSKNYAMLTKGHVAEDVRRSEDEAHKDHVESTILVQDADLVHAIDRGLRKELSSGYECDLEEVAGVYEGERYDARQRNIRYNHVAAGPEGWGRAGPTASFRLDGIEPQEQQIMKTVRIDGKDYVVGSDEHLSKLEADSAAAVKAERERADGLAAELKATKERADSLEKSVPQLVEQRVSLVADAVRICGRTYKADGKDDQAVRRDIVAKLVEQKRVDSKALVKFDGLAKTPDASAVFFDALKTAYDAMATIGKAPEGEGEEEESMVEGEDEEEENLDSEEATPKAAKQDSFTARARTETPRTSGRDVRVDAASARVGMMKRFGR